MERILHTSDWHLGGMLRGEERSAHFSAMLDGIFDTIVAQKISCLLICGDIFDVINPPIQAQNLYYEFLARLDGTSCRDVVIISGNHDSARLLAAPKGVLRKIGVHVVTSIAEDTNLVPIGSDLVILAIPFLKEGSLGEIIGETERERSSSFAMVASSLLSHLSDKANALYPGRRQIVMAHQFLVGSMMDNGKTEIDYVGNLAPLPCSIFPPRVDYVALGHIHRPQVVKGAVPIRYSGSPLPIDFGEAGQQKQVVLITTDPWEVTPLDLPPFCNLVKLEGDLPLLKREIHSLVEKREPIWVSADYTGEEAVQNLRKTLGALTQGTSVHLVQVLDRRAWQREGKKETVKDLKMLTPMQVFERKLDTQNFDEETKAMLRRHMKEIIHCVEHPEEDA